MKLVINEARLETLLRPVLRRAELHVFCGLAVGHSNKRIAMDADIKSPAVSQTKVRVMRKLRVRSEAELVVYALRNELIKVIE